MALFFHSIASLVMADHRVQWFNICYSVVSTSQCCYFRWPNAQPLSTETLNPSYNDIATAQWQTTKPAEARVCLHPTDRPTFLRTHNSKTRWPISVIQTLSESSWDALGSSFVKTRRPASWRGSAKRDVTYPITTVVYNTCYHLFRKCPYITVDHDNNTTPAIYAMHRSIIRLEYKHCNEK